MGVSNTICLCLGGLFLYPCYQALLAVAFSIIYDFKCHVKWGEFVLVYGGFVLFCSGFVLVCGGFVLVRGGFVLVHGGFVLVHGGFVLVHGVLL